MWLFGIVLSFVVLSTILLWKDFFNYSFNSLFYRFYFNLIAFQNDFITINISKLFWFIPFSIYFILGILVGHNYERFKEKLLKYRYAIVTTWILLLIVIPIIIKQFNLIYTGYFNVEGIFFGIASIFFFFLIFLEKASKFFAINRKIAVAIFLIMPLVFTLVLIFYFEVGWWSFFMAFYLGGFFFLIYTQRGSKFFAINGKIAVAIFLTQPFVLTLLLRFYFPAGWWLSNVVFYLGGLFYGLTSVFSFILAYKLWGSRFFYFNKKLAVAIFLIPLVVFTIVLSFLSFPLTSPFDFFVFSICNFLFV
jgi:hypothetical protein